MLVLNEDTRYRASSQYRLWSFTPGTLASLRNTANVTASARVRKRRKLSHPPDTSSKTTEPTPQNPTTTSSPSSSEIEPLSANQELTYLTHILLPRLSQIATIYFTSLPHLPRIKNTASQYLRRYYLTHSPMEPAPSQSAPDASSSSPAKSKSHAAPNPDPRTTLSAPTMLALASLYLATKVHDAPLALADFVARVRDKGSREGMAGAMTLTVEGMKRAEAGLTRTLRFCFEVRHAGEGVRGVELELLGGLLGDVGGVGGKGKGMGERQRRLSLELVDLCTREERRDRDGEGQNEESEGQDGDNAGQDARLRSAQERVKEVLEAVQRTLDSTVHTTDAYFLHTPSQILFAALMLHDQALAEWYLGTKFPTASADEETKNGDVKQEEDAVFDMRDKVFAAIRACMSLLRDAAETKPDKAQNEELEARLWDCQSLLVTAAGPDEETGDEGSKSVKRNGSQAFDSTDEDDEGPISGARRKKRKIEDDDVFGAPL